MGRNPARPPLTGHLRRHAEEIRQLRIRPNNPEEIVDLTDYLDTGWSPISYLENPDDENGDPETFAVIYREGTRVWMAGAVEYVDAGSIESGALIASATPLPEQFRPRDLANVTFDFDQENTGWSPAPFGDSSDAVVGASIQADVLPTGYINFESLVANYQGRARKTDNTHFYSGVPSGSVLILDGISWMTADTG